jgi:hypothetical protein
MSLTAVVHAFGLARSQADLSEDAYAVDAPAGRIALADGASSAWRAGDWAAALAAAWVADAPGPDRPFGAWLEGPRAAFTAEDAALVDRPWFTSAAAARGAHAAFVGLVLEVDDGQDGGAPRWRTSAVGDVCCFHVRDDRLIAATPVDAADHFTSRPDLLASLPDADVPTVVTAAGTLVAGDVLLLASDALAACLLHLDAAGEPVWATVRRLDAASFRAFVAASIGAGLLERDDATLVRVALAAEVDS